jgi:type VII secretion-associated serine protease mycosin
VEEAVGQRLAGLRRWSAALVVACLVGTWMGAVWQPRPATAETIRELSWFLDAMHARDAHRISRGERITVAVVDTGVDASHPDLRGRVQPGIDVGDHASPQVSPRPGADGRSDTDGHGTGMASLIAGAGHGVNSVLGIAPAARVLPVRIAQTSNGSFQPVDVYQGVRWAIDHGADIVNMSLGGERSTDAPWKKQLVEYAMAKDVVLIAAAGNTGQGDRRVAEPASIPGVVSVSGVTRSGRFWKGSAKGPEVVVSAPAEDLPMAAPTSVSESGYVLADGTSGATALVSGVAALIRSAFPDISANDVINRLIRTAEDRGPAGRDEEYGFGVIDARAALEGEVPSVRHHPLVSPEPARSGDAVAGFADRRTRQGVLVVVGVFISMVLFLLVVAYLWHLARRSRQIVVAGVAPGVGVVQVSGGIVWGRSGGAPWPADQGGVPQWPSVAQAPPPSPPGHWMPPRQHMPPGQTPPGHSVPARWPSGPPAQPVPMSGHLYPPPLPRQYGSGPHPESGSSEPWSRGGPWQPDAPATPPSAPPGTPDL